MTPRRQVHCIKMSTMAFYVVHIHEHSEVIRGHSIVSLCAVDINFGLSFEMMWGVVD